MKQLTCEVCGSNDLMKQDGIFVCQVCGCKYSLEDVKKMMVEGVVEISGTVKVDNSSAIKNYLNMAKNASDAGNYKEAEEYCNKIIEIDVTNLEAWFHKGEAVGWQSTLANSRIPETINAFTNAIENCPEEEKEALKNRCKDILDRINTAILSLRSNRFKSNPDNSDVNGLGTDFRYINNSIAFYKKYQIKMNGTEYYLFGRKINIGLCEAWDITREKYNNSDDGYPYKYAWERYYKEGDALISGFQQIISFLGTEYDRSDTNGLIIQLYKNMIVLQENLVDSCSYSISFSNGYKQHIKDWSFTAESKRARRNQISGWENKIREVETVGAKRVIEAARKRKEEYWNAHKEIKESLEKEKLELEQAKSNLLARKQEFDTERENVPTAKVVAEFNKRISALSQEKNNLGLFKSKEKKDLQAQIDVIEAQMLKHKAVMESEQAEVDKKILPVTTRMAEIDKRLSAIQGEFDKER